MNSGSIFDTFCKDVSFLYKTLNGRRKRLDDEQALKVNLAASRVFSTISMIAGIVITALGVSTLPKTFLGGFVVIALGITTFVLSHDLFRIAQNMSRLTEPKESARSEINAAVRGVWATFTNLSEVEGNRVALQSRIDDMTRGAWILKPVIKKIVDDLYDKKLAADRE